MSTQIGIKSEHLDAVAQKLAALLADEFLLSTKTKNAHWNVEGVDFLTKHTFFESQFEKLDDIIDDLAERIRSLGHYTPATLKEFLQLTSLTEQSRSPNTSQGYMKELLADHESIIIHLRENINRFSNEFHDLGSSDFITNMLTTHEKMAWMLRAHIIN